MEITEQRQGAVTVVKPGGPLCQSESEQFSQRIDEVMARSLGRFVLDASGIAYVDSAGLESLLRITNDLAESGRSLRVCAANETLREVMDLTGLADRFEFYEDVNAAVRSFL